MTRVTNWGTPTAAFHEFYSNEYLDDVKELVKQFEGVYVSDLGYNENGIWWNVWTDVDIPLYSYDIAARYDITETTEIKYVGIIYDEDDHCIAEIAVSCYCGDVFRALMNHFQEQLHQYCNGEETMKQTWEAFDQGAELAMREAAETKFEDDNDFDCFG